MRRFAIPLFPTLIFGWLAAAMVAEEPLREDDLPLLLDAAPSSDGDISLTTMLEEWAVEEGSLCDACGSLGCEACCGSGCVGCYPSWAVTADAVFLKRSGPESSREPFPLNDAIDFDFDTGWRLTARRHLGSGCDLEFSYLGFDTAGTSPPRGEGEAWVESVWRPVYEPDGSLTWESEAWPVTGPATRTYSSDLDSAEINMARPLGCRTKVFAGFRWLQLDENLIDRDVNSAFYGVGTQNDLYGFQLGAEALLLEHCRGCLEWHAGVKAGVYYNHTARRITAPYPFSHGSADETAFCGEATITATYRLTNWASIRAGYQLLCLSGVALASEQPPIIDPYVPFPVDAEGDLYYHGALVGLEIRH
jgi:hypothetical protein